MFLLVIVLSESKRFHTPKVVIVGAGFVGSTFAYSLVISGLVPEIFFIYVDTKRVEGRLWFSATALLGSMGQRGASVKLDKRGRNKAERLLSLTRQYDHSCLDSLFKKVRDATYEIIERKGRTYYDIGLGLS